MQKINYEGKVWVLNYNNPEPLLDHAIHMLERHGVKREDIEITLINTENSEIQKSLHLDYLPNSILITIQNSAQLQSLSEYQFFAGKSFEDKTSVFICKNFTCSLPLHTLEEINSNL